MFNLTKLALLWDWVNVLKKDSADVHGDLAALDGRLDIVEALLPKIPKDYSTTETATGQKWTDGRDVYRKVFTGKFPEITSSQSVTIETAIFENIVSFTSILKLTNNTVAVDRFYPVITPSTGAAIFSAVSTGFSECDYIIIEEYTKPDPTPGRAPEDPEETPEETKKITKKKSSK